MIIMYCSAGNERHMSQTIIKNLLCGLPTRHVSQTADTRSPNSVFVVCCKEIKMSLDIEATS